MIMKFFQQGLFFLIGILSVLIIGGIWLSPPNPNFLLLQTNNNQSVQAQNSPQSIDRPKRDLRIVVISDLNSAYGSTSYEPEVHQALKLIPTLKPDLVLCSGDMVAGQNPKLSNAQIQAMWAAFDRQIAQPLRQQNIPFGFTLGNHDASSALDQNQRYRFQNERNLAANYWQNPAHNPGVKFVDKTDFPFYYTFSQNKSFFLVWDGSSHHIPADKLAWVEKSLASPAARRAKVRMVIGHLPLYAVAEGRNKPGEVMKNAEQLRALLERYQVHTYVSGHQHAYYPGKRGNLELLHTGLLGAGPRALIGSQRRSPKTLTILDLDFDQPDLVGYTTYDMATLTVIETRTLPRFLLGHNGRVLRRDLTTEQLSPSEQQTCETKLSRALCDA
jgi:hypothetical protein